MLLSDFQRQRLARPDRHHADPMGEHPLITDLRSLESGDAPEPAGILFLPENVPNDRFFLRKNTVFFFFFELNLQCDRVDRTEESEYFQWHPFPQTLFSDDSCASQLDKSLLLRS